MKKYFIGAVFLLIVSVFVVGCGGGHAEAEQTDSEMSESNSPKASFLIGGNYGKLSYKLIEYGGFTDLPYLGGWSMNNINSVDTIPSVSELPFMVYGGVLNSFGNSYQIYGNTFVKNPAKLRYLLIPNFEVTALNTPVHFRLTAKEIEKQLFDGCLSEKIDGSLMLTNNKFECENISLISNVVFTKTNQALEVEVDLGEFYTSLNAAFSIKQTQPNFDLTYSTAHGSISTILTVNLSASSELPPNVIAHGDFLPNPDGFGFSNSGMIDPNVLTNSDIAEMYGADAVCFNANESDCKISAYGTFLKQSRTNISGGTCYGMTVAAMMLKKGIPFKGKSKISDYNGNAKNTISLNHSDVARLIAYKVNSQYTPEMLDYFLSPDGACKNMTIKQVLDRITLGFGSDDPIMEAGMFSASGGHSVTPYAVSKMTEDNYRIYVYDNNYPGSNEKYIDTHISTNSFYYDGAQNSQSPDLIYSEKYAPLCVTPLSMHQYYKINIQPVNSFQFNIDTSRTKSVLVSNNSYLTNFLDFENKSETLNIPNSAFVKGGDQSWLTINNVLPPPFALNIITSRSALEPYLTQSYLTRVTPQDNADANINISSLTARYANGFSINQKHSANGESSMSYKIHPSSRIVVVDKPENLMLTIFMDNNSEKLGYIYTIKVTDTISYPNASLGTLIADNGELEVFVFDATNFQKLESSINYTITASIQNTDGIFPRASKSISQAVNSALKISYKGSGSAPSSISKRSAVQMNQMPSIAVEAVY